jgi:hypothetical protein
VPDPSPTGQPTDFDFLRGHWRVTHRRLKRRLQGCTDWETFGGRSRNWPLMDGLGNVDDNWIDLPTGAYRATSLRAFDPQARQWAIWWLDGRMPGRIETPIRGGFDGRVGTFWADEDFEGRPIRVRFRWSVIDADTARWEQAFSPDAGQTWETNWQMDFHRDTETVAV